jgi:phosphoglycolate phosphatase-like HAD superfamily hydrolase
VRPLLVLWDVDFTLLDAPGVGRHLYEQALAELYGLELPAGLQSMAGRTDASIAIEVLTLANVPDPAGELGAFQKVQAARARAPELTAMLRERGRVLPGAAEAIAALAAPGYADWVIQSLLTGNIPALAEVKLGALGLTEHLDLTVGAYGDHSQVRADLVAVARDRAAARYGGDYAGRATVLIGDTPKDVEAAALTGARSVGVASGSYTEQQLADAGADAVLADLTDTGAVIAAILGNHGAAPG